LGLNRVCPQMSFFRHAGPPSSAVALLRRMDDPASRKH
jgi:hypothetical protein